MTIAIEGGTPRRIGFATTGCRRRGDVDAPRSRHPSVAWLASDAPKIFSDAKPQVKALRRAGVALGGLAFDTIVAGWLLRPSFPDKTLARPRRPLPRREAPRGRPHPARPRDRGRDARSAVLVHAPSRDGAARRAAAERGIASSPTSSCRRSSASPTWSSPASPSRTRSSPAFSGELAQRADAIAQEAYAAIGREVNLGSPKQLQEVLFDELQLPKTRKTKTGYSTDAAVLADLQETNPHPFLDLLLQHREATKLRQIIESLDVAIAADGRIRTTYVQTGSQTGRLVEHRPQPAEHPGPHRGEPSHPRGVRGRRRLRDAADRRLLADRDADHGASLRGSRAHRGVQLGRGPAPLRRRARLRRRPAGGDLGDAHQGQGDVVRPRVRAVGVRPLQAAAHRAVPRRSSS